MRSKEETSLMLVRVIISLIIATHGWHRLLTGGYEPFGEWLSGQGFPFGLVIAWGITLIEVIGSPLLAFGKKLLYLCAIYIIIYMTGLFLVHLQNGWFVVGAGRNGIEYSVLIIVCLIAIGLPEVKKLLGNT
ncbi:DoxX family protein [Aliikangiella sp. IMCC44359]|uniref:DoxX family protein n=1 Tax=Aliikangiella sp. IMCC44359 TaxID=3459125 RepID=UPI00403A9014